MELTLRLFAIFNTYGPAMTADDGRVISNFVVQALGGEDITIYGDGTQTRSFCYVDDLINVIVKMMNSRRSTTGQSTLEISEYQIIEIAKQSLGWLWSVENSIHALPMTTPGLADISLAA